MVLLLSACMFGPPKAPPRDPARPDVVIVVVDTLRADRLSAYGYGLPTSEPLASFFATSTRFTHATAPAPWTLPSTTTLLTGLEPSRHGVIRSGDAVPSPIETLPERLHAAGWRTTAVSHNYTVSEKTNFLEGFDTFVQHPGFVLDYPDAGQLLDEALDPIDADLAPPQLLYVQPMNCHGPYRVPEPHRQALLGRAPAEGFTYYGKRMAQIMANGKVGVRAQVGQGMQRSLHEQYDTAVRYTLDRVAALFTELQARGLYDDALIILTADHGEELFDHGGFSHGYSLYQEVLHVPLFVKMPRQREARVVDTAVGLVDITPTVLDVTGQPSGDLDGRSLAGAARGEMLAARPYVARNDWKKRFLGRALRDGPYKLVEIDRNYEGLHNEVRLFDLARDPGETMDLAPTMPERVEQMRTQLAAHVAAVAARPSWTAENKVDELDEERLRALGYVE